MSVPARTGKLFAPPNESGGEALAFWSPLPPPCQQQFEDPCLIKYPSFKKPISSDTVLNPRITLPVSRSIDAIPFKTQLCTKFRLGNCSYGNHCHFAHGIGDIRKLPPGKQGRVVEIWDENRRIISERLCRKFWNGEECPYGVRCHFVHKGLKKVREDIGLSRKNTAISISTTGSGGDCRSGSDPFEYTRVVNSSLNANGVNQNQVFWKTRPCRKWETTSYCPYGDRCSYAHGLAELQKLGNYTALESGNVSVSKARAIPSKYASTSRIVIETSYKQQLQGKKCLFKRKGVEKITGIYADWIDDMPLLHSSLGRVGS
ncbi:zinc finger CCCH domain-containing protein 39-like [Cornus florida]|uniref:zinc finger CCCH domain-containing protein 39-like n=1 Tax=Cornus florida TaxID=4283 RepID=UPI0028A28862|nr:zinc finger CCCH domain-containing protein 39-like [Cornus florida]XP_059642498.1 zinc finger CCCH domain-containing protein 39-like [Cornus florida]XP_059642499.1 zinc finger CCCH domain-containing protein 39-like [Cornus florida]XP_059642500.1 zinc finger CCCH domain-containing protein 39-like [Cornus florida]